MTFTQCTFAWPQRGLGQDDVVAGKVSGDGVVWIGQDDVAQVPLVGEVAVPHRYADRQDLADRLRVDDVMIRVRVRCAVCGPRQSEQVRVVLFLLETPVQPLRRRTTACT